MKSIMTCSDGKKYLSDNFTDCRKSSKCKPKICRMYKIYFRFNTAYIQNW